MFKYATLVKLNLILSQHPIYSSITFDIAYQNNLNGPNVQCINF